MFPLVKLFKVLISLVQAGIELQFVCSPQQTPWPRRLCARPAIPAFKPLVFPKTPLLYQYSFILLKKCWTSGERKLNCYYTVQHDCVYRFFLTTGAFFLLVFPNSQRTNCRDIMWSLAVCSCLCNTQSWRIRRSDPHHKLRLSVLYFSIFFLKDFQLQTCRSAVPGLHALTPAFPFSIHPFAWLSLDHVGVLHISANLNVQKFNISCNKRRRPSSGVIIWWWGEVADEEVLRGSSPPPAGITNTHFLATPTQASLTTCLTCEKWNSSLRITVLTGSLWLHPTRRTHAS